MCERKTGSELGLMNFGGVFFVSFGNCRARLSNMDRLIKMDCTGWLWSCPWLHVPQIKVRSRTSLVRCSRKLLIRWWAVVPYVEDEVDVRPANNVVHEEGEFQRQREEEVHLEEVYMEGSGSEWEEGRSSSSLELRSASPKSPLVIPDSPNARAYLIALNSIPY